MKLINKLNSKTNTDFIYISVMDGFYVFYNKLIMIFGILFFYQLWNSYILAFMPFILGRLVMSFIMIATAGWFAKLGTRVGMYVGWLLMIIAGVPIYLFQISGNHIWTWIWIGLFFASKAILFVPWLYLMGNLSSHKNRGQQFALKKLILVFATVSAPLVGGILSSLWGYSSVMALTSIFMITGLFIINHLPDIKIKLNMKQLSFWTKSKAKHSIATNTIYELGANGSEQIWLLLLFILTGSSMLNFGLLITASLAITIVLTLITGKVLTHYNRKLVFKISTSIMGIAHLFRSLTLIPVFAIELIGRIASEIYSQIFEVYWFDLTNYRVKKDLRDETMVLVLLHNNLSIAFVLFIASIIVQFFGLEVGLFIFGAVMIISPWIFSKYLPND